MCLIFVCPAGGFPPEYGKPTFFLVLIRLLLIITLTVLMIIFIVYFVIALHALGNDIDLARETHLTHKAHHREEHVFGVTNSDKKERHITTLIVWTLVSMMATIFTSAGLIGAINLNGCLVIFYVLWSICLAMSGFYYPYLTPSEWILVVQIVSVVFSVLFVLTLRCCAFKKHRKEVTFSPRTQSYRQKV